MRHKREKFPELYKTEAIAQAVKDWRPSRLEQASKLDIGTWMRAAHGLDIRLSTLRAIVETLGVPMCQVVNCSCVDCRGMNSNNSKDKRQPRLIGNLEKINEG